MKKILFILSCLVISVTSFAQTADDHSDEKSKGEKMKALLGLNDDQTVKFRAIVEERRAAIKTARADASLDAAALTEKLKAIDVVREEKLKTVFSPDQFTKWKEYKEQKKKE